MKIKSLIIVFLLSSFSRLISQTIPPVPKRIQMFDLNINLDEDTRRTIEKEMNFLASKRTAVDNKLAKMSLFFPIIEEIFEQESIPTEFKYLCAQESSFISDAVSTSNAVGFWQFKSGTATDYGLRVDNEIDERKNIVSATRAAAKYLKNNNKSYQNWVSTLLSYRLGLTGAKSQIPANWTNATEITITNNIDWYVIRNIAHFIFFENELENYEIRGDYFHLYSRAGGKSFGEIAYELGSDENEIKKLNTWCTVNPIPTDKDYTLICLIKKNDKAPIISLSQKENKPFFDIEIGYPILKKDDKKSRKGAVFYTINNLNGILSRVGDTPQIIADRAGLKLDYFLSYNDLDKTAAIQPKMVYYLERKNRKAKTDFHTTKKGETIWQIAQMYGVKERRVLRMNRMNEEEALQTGRVLYLKSRRAKKTAIEIVPMPSEKIYLPKNTNILVENKSTIEKPNSGRIYDLPISKIAENESQIDLSGKNNKQDIESNEPMKVVVRDEPVLYTPAKTKVTNNEPISQESITVKPGETLYAISKKYDLDIEDLKKINNLENNTLNSGQKIYVSTINKGAISSTFDVKSNKQSAVTSTKSTMIHVVQPGETLYKLSRINNVSVDLLKRLNGLADNSISVGQRIKLKE